MPGTSLILTPSKHNQKIIFSVSYVTLLSLFDMLVDICYLDFRGYPMCKAMVIVSVLVLALMSVSVQALKLSQSPPSVIKSIGDPVSRHLRKIQDWIAYW